jgi:hypothetical protein
MTNLGVFDREMGQARDCKEGQVDSEQARPPEGSLRG